MITKLKLAFMITAVLTLVGVAPSFAQQVPNWAEGTFTARNPYTGGRIELTINRNGSVTSNVDGRISYGTYRSQRLTINGVTSRVSRTRDGIRTVRQDNNERIDYTRGSTGWNGGNVGGNVPDWAVGTFYATSPLDRSTITLTIAQNGRVTSYLNNEVSYGTLNGTTLNINGATARIARTRDGLTTTRTDNREQISYTRRGGNGGGIGPGWGNEPRGDVPNWAVGTFYTSMPRAGSIELTITSDGRVMVSFDGGPVEYGSMYRDRLTLRGATSQVTRTRNGIRTTRLDNRERIDYTRRNR